MNEANLLAAASDDALISQFMGHMGCLDAVEAVNFLQMSNYDLETASFWILEQSHAGDSSAIPVDDGGEISEPMTSLHQLQLQQKQQPLLTLVRLRSIFCTMEGLRTLELRPQSVTVTSRQYSAG